MNKDIKTFIVYSKGINVFIGLKYVSPNLTRGVCCEDREKIG